MLKLRDKNGKLMTYRLQENGAVLSKGKRDIYFIFKSADAGDRARRMIANNSFNQIFIDGKKKKILGRNVSYIVLV